MQGYFRPRLTEVPQEIRALELEEIEFVPDDESVVVKSLAPVTLERRSYRHTCPRCTSCNRIVGQYPYCPECSWDSLEEQEWRLPCVA